MSETIKSTLLIIFFTVHLHAFAQDNFTNAEKAFANAIYTEAIELYKKSFMENKTDPTKQAEITFKIALSYHKLKSYSDAELWYKRAILVQYNDPVALLNYAEVLRLNKKMKQAEEQYNLFLKQVPNDARGKKGLALCTKPQSEDTKEQSVVKDSESKNSAISEKKDNEQQKNSTEINVDTKTFAQKIDSCKSLIARLSASGNKKELSETYSDMARLYYFNGDITNALEYYNQNLKYTEESGDKSGASTSLLNMGIVYNNGYQYNEAINCFQKSLQIKQQINDKSGESKLLYRIANVYYNKHDLDNTVSFFTRSLELEKTLKNEKNIAISNNNLGVAYYEQSNYEKSLEHLRVSLQLSKNSGSNLEASIVLNNIGNIKTDQKKYDEALEMYKQSLALKEQLKYNKGIAITLFNIGNIYREKGNFDLAIENFKRCEKIALESNFFDILHSAYMALSECYTSKNDCEKAFGYFKSADAYKRFALHFKKNKPISEMQSVSSDGAQNDDEISLLTEEIAHQRMMIQEVNQRREMEHELQRAELARKESELNVHKTEKYALFIGIIFMLIVAFLLFRSFRIKKQQNAIIKLKNEELQQQKEEIIVQRDLVTFQKEKIELIHAELTDSIYYAERIQTAVMPTQEHIAEVLCSYSMPADSIFILYKPRNIVSGDFCFFETRNRFLLMAVADCTGHGVPGGFMSMLGISFLNEIIAKEHIKTAAQVLDELRRNIIHSLQQRGVMGEQKDGMDISFVAYDTVTRVIQYAGANNPLYIISHETGELSLIKPDKMPVAIFEKMDPFTNHSIQLHPGDIIYQVSDGYEDQFGGPMGKKFLSKRLRQMFIDNCSKSMSEQKNIFEKIHNDWREKSLHSYDQTDDITLMGFKIS